MWPPQNIILNGYIIMWPPQNIVKFNGCSMMGPPQNIVLMVVSWWDHPRTLFLMAVS